MAIAATAAVVILGYACAYWIFEVQTLCRLIGPPVCFEMEVVGEPLVGAPVDLKLQLTSPDKPNRGVSVVLELPPQVQVLSGSTEWQGDIAADQTAEHVLTIAVKEPGLWAITAHARSASSGWFEETSLYLLSSFQTASVSATRPPNHWYDSSSASGPPETTPDERFSSTIALSNDPSLGEEIVVRYQLIPEVRLEEASIVMGFPPRGFEVTAIEYPPGAVRTSEDPEFGRIQWRGDLIPGQLLALSARFRIRNTGEGSVYAYLSYDILEGEVRRNIRTAVREIRLQVTEVSGRFEIVAEPGS